MDHHRSKSASAVDAVGKTTDHCHEHQAYPLMVFNKEQGTNAIILPRKESYETDHCHSSVEANRVDTVARRKLIIASVLCLFFMIAEIVGGSLANSLAIMTDAAHLLSDFASFMISLFALYLASRPATKKMSFGWHRAEVMGALISVLFIWVVTGILVYVAILRIINGDYEIDSNVMLITSGIGVMVNIIMACSLHQHSHGHSHGLEKPREDNVSDNYDVESANCANEATDPHQDNSATETTGLLQGNRKSDLIAEVRVTSNKDRKPKLNKTNINVRAAFIHVIGDLVQSVGVLLAAYLIYFKPSWKIADPVCTFIFSILVLFTTINILKDAMNVLMEGTPKSLDFDDVKNTLMTIDGVCLLHNLRIWSLTLNKTALSVHLAVDPTKDVQVILKEATKILMAKYHISDATIQVENYVADMDDCEKCQDPQA